MRRMSKMKSKKVNPKSIAFIGMLAALSAVLMTISVSALFAGFFMGLLSGCMHTCYFQAEKLRFMLVGQKKTVTSQADSI